MSDLSYVGLAIGSLLLLFGLRGWFMPAAHATSMDRFPRHRGFAVVLTLINVAWVTWLLFDTPLGRFEGLKPLLYILAPLTFYAVIQFMDELLAPRMWGGLLLLAAAPVLDIARWHDSTARLVITVLVYLWVVWGIILVLSPYRFRHWVSWLRRNQLTSVAAVASVLLGGALITLALTIY